MKCKASGLEGFREHTQPLIFFYSFSCIKRGEKEREQAALRNHRGLGREPGIERHQRHDAVAETKLQTVMRRAR